MSKNCVDIKNDCKKKKNKQTNDDKSSLQTPKNSFKATKVALDKFIM